MPTHSETKTPPERRRAPAGTTLAVERGLREVHQGDTVRLKGTEATAEVTSVEATAPLPIFISFHSLDFAPKQGDVLDPQPKPGDKLPALIAQVHRASGAASVRGPRALLRGIELQPKQT
ncbi:MULTISPECIES: hypothetical protein [unclassified Corallococcus]|uniref:hypothetical protein n=1 Tax=unclassified Corallococcus TaxID=2685029 RepID=UPI001A8CA8A6|nr:MULTISPECIES: hypothetical protein [unclassified Corallococcus]MBN9683435.1 hypothetical protein [Corallococcus sp. NCSPR001]WAS85047.1 hypothetical protein O0N60_38055 [Corallococcus sp. NCRR]